MKEVLTEKEDQEAN
ncbi:MAG: hypothetical protein J07AB43_11520 [Candidatus Nanosalina sp. J07AB43]|nr:MAG: hypothetical protein J07AB43_11520 [Candidatus Nanosalina sp. J07AB43]